MPDLPTQSFATIVAQAIAGIQGRARSLINFSQGSTLRAIVEGFTGVFLWFQSLVLQLLTACRLSTATGIDVDTFTADFMPVLPGSQSPALPGGSPRLGAQASSGNVTFTRFTAGNTTVFIPVGGTVRTNDGLQTFAVTADANYQYYTTTPSPGYLLPALVGSLTAPVQNTVPGSAGNVAAGTITQITSAITGIDQVINNSSFLNGFDFESDAALKKRFSDWILGLSRGDLFGTEAAIEGTNVDVQWAITEFYNLDGSWRGGGYYLIVVDDGSGAPAPSILQTVTDAANSVRPLGTQVGVFPPTILWVTIGMQITIDANYDSQSVIAEVSALIATNINQLGLANTLFVTQLSGWPYSIAGVTGVYDVSINGLFGDQADVYATRLTQDGFALIGYATVKCLTVNLSQAPSPITFVHGTTVE